MNPKPHLLTLLCCLPLLTQGATFSWNNSAGGAWNVPANWSPAGVPGQGDTASVSLPGAYTVTIPAAVTVDTLVLGATSANAVLLLDGQTLTIKSSASVKSGSTLSCVKGTFAGPLSVEVGGIFELGAQGAMNLQDCTIINQGTVRWLGNNIGLGGYPFTAITNHGTLEIRADANMSHSYGGVPVFVNLGTVRKVEGAGNTIFSGLMMEQRGLLQLDKGSVQIASGGGRFVVSGSYQLAAGTELNLTSGTVVEGGGTFSGQGRVRLNGATLRLVTDTLPWLNLDSGLVYVEPAFQQAGAITNLTITGATLSGTNRVAGQVSVTKGAITGVLTIQPGGVLELGADGPVNLQDCTIINQGTVRWLGNNIGLGGYPFTAITNAAVFEIWTDAVMSHSYGGAPVLWNSGTLVKTAGSGTSTISLPQVYNPGLIEAESGTLQLPNSFTNTTGTLRLSGGTLRAQDFLRMTGGVLQGSGGVRQILITGGQISPGVNGPGQILFSQGLTLAPAVNVIMDASGANPGSGHDQIAVQGAVNLAGAQFQFTQVPVVAPGTAFVVISNDAADAISGTFGSVPEGYLFTLNNQLFRVRYASGTGNDVSVIRDPGGAILTSPIVRTNLSQFELRGWGTNNANYAIEASTNFIHWEYMGTVTADGGGAFRFVDTDRTNYLMRFYRSLGP